MKTNVDYAIRFPKIEGVIFDKARRLGIKYGPHANPISGGRIGGENMFFGLVQGDTQKPWVNYSKYDEWFLRIGFPQGLSPHTDHLESWYWKWGYRARDEESYIALRDLRKLELQSICITQELTRLNSISSFGLRKK